MIKILFLLILTTSLPLMPILQNNPNTMLVLTTIFSTLFFLSVKDFAELQADKDN
jgi:hypothetical protein